MNYLWKLFLFCGVAICSISLVCDQLNGAMLPDEKLQLAIRSFKPTYQYQESISIDVELRNISKEKLFVLKTLYPEGWLIRIAIKDTRGIAVYNSPLVKIEMTAAMLETIPIEQNHFFGTSFIIEKTFATGEYIIEAIYSTTLLSKRKNINIPIGNWKSNIIKMKVLGKEIKE